MQNKKLIRFVESFLLMPIATLSVPFSNIPRTDFDLTQTPQIVLSQKQNIEANGLFAFNNEVDQKAEILKVKANAIDTYFKEHEMPLEGTGMKMATEADKNGLDWRLLPAIAVRESTGGVHACKKVTHSFFGWGSCKIGFDSDDEAIEVVAKNLSGNDPDTAHHYSGKTTKEILQKYNPPTIVPHYADQVMKIMNEIGDADIIIDKIA